MARNVRQDIPLRLVRLPLHGHLALGGEGIVSKRPRPTVLPGRAGSRAASRGVRGRQRRVSIFGHTCTA
jgi:hypothetical protein